MLKLRAKVKISVKFSAPSNWMNVESVSKKKSVCTLIILAILRCARLKTGFTYWMIYVHLLSVGNNTWQFDTISHQQPEKKPTTEYHFNWKFSSKYIHATFGIIFSLLIGNGNTICQSISNFDLNFYYYCHCYYYYYSWMLVPFSARHCTIPFNILAFACFFRRRRLLLILFLSPTNT